MIIIGLLILGLALGSFVNALVWRLHEQNKPKQKRAASDKDLSIISGRSMCPNCRHTLAWYDLLPIVSWITLGGKCHYCRKPISWQYPLVEVATALLFIVSYLYWPLIFSGSGLVFFGLWLIFVVGFMALLIYDLRWMILPNRIVFPLQALALLYLLFQLTVSSSIWTSLLATSLSILCSAGLFYAIFQISHGKWIGGGDVKLAVILGALLASPLHAFMMLFLASLMGSIVGIPLLLGGKAKANTRLPFGPFLIISTIIVYLFGSGLMQWYSRQILFM